MTHLIGFLGLGVMGQPMALNLARAGTDLVVWNRTTERTGPLAAAGASVASSVDELFDRAYTVFVMLVDERVTDTVLGRGTDDFARRMAGRLVISTGSTSPDYSRGLSDDIRAAGGRYVEAPVSGSRKPAEAGELVALVAGDPLDVAEARDLLRPLCRTILACGPIGSGLLMKLAVNLYLDVSIAALSEAVHFAQGNGLDLAILDEAIQSGQLASPLTRVKVPKLIGRDFEVQAATQDGYANTLLIAAAARAAGISTPLLDMSRDLYGEAVALGNARLDMSSVLTAIEARTNAQREPWG